jgi:hypothetical protein
MGYYENIRELISIAQKADNIDLYRRILDLQAEIQEMASKLLEREDTIRTHEATIAELEEKFALKDRLVFYSGSYFLTDEHGRPEGRAFCARCWEVDHRTIHVHQDPRARQVSVCPECKATYKWIPTQKPDPPQAG